MKCWSKLWYFRSRKCICLNVLRCERFGESSKRHAEKRRGIPCTSFVTDTVWSLAVVLNARKMLWNTRFQRRRQQLMAITTKWHWLLCSSKLRHHTIRDRRSLLQISSLYDGVDRRAQSRPQSSVRSRCIFDPTCDDLVLGNCVL